MTDYLKSAETFLECDQPASIHDLAECQAHALIDIAESLRTIASRPAIDPSEAAIDTIARYILADAAETAAAEGWERYPEIGEHDWARVGAAYPPDSEFTAAYGLMDGRADHE